MSAVSSSSTTDYNYFPLLPRELALEVLSFLEQKEVSSFLASHRTGISREERYQTFLQAIRDAGRGMSITQFEISKKIFTPLKGPNLIKYMCFWNHARILDLTDQDVDLIRLHFSDLERLTLSNRSLSDLRICEYLPKLKDLSLYHTNLAHFSLDSIGLKCPHIRKLNLGNSFLSSFEVAKIPLLWPELEELNLAFLALEQETIIEIAKKCTQLSKWNLDGTDLRDESLRAIGFHLKQLKKIYFGYNPLLSDAGFEALRGLPLEIVELPVLTGPRFTSDGVIALVSPFLKKLDLESCRGVTNEAAFLIGDICSDLKDLKIVNTSIDPVGLNHLASRCKKLEEVGFPESADDKSLIALAENNRNLQALTVVGSDSSISDKALEALAQNCPNLRELRLYPGVLRNRKLEITNRGLFDLKRRCPLLTFIWLRGAHLVTAGGIESLKRDFPGLSMMD